MSQIGKKVKVHYTGTLDDGTEFDSSLKRGEPLAFMCGAGQMIPGFDAAVADMEIGEKRLVHIPAAEAYGEYDVSRVGRVPLAILQGLDERAVGQYIVLRGNDGVPVRLLVKAIEGDRAILDQNHELAGKDLNFEIELLEVEPADPAAAAAPVEAE